jgi:hypothetical protein
MLKIINLNFLFISSKFLKWFGVEGLGASPWNLGFKLWRICAYMYVMCIHIDVIMYKYGIWNMYDDGQYFQNILLRKPNANNNNNIKSWHVFLSRHVMKIYNLWLKKKVKKCYMMTWHVNPHHINLGPHNIHVNFFKL